MLTRAELSGPTASHWPVDELQTCHWLGDCRLAQLVFAHMVQYSQKSHTSNFYDNSATPFGLRFAGWIHATCRQGWWYRDGWKRAHDNGKPPAGGRAAAQAHKAGSGTPPNTPTHPAGMLKSHPPKSPAPCATPTTARSSPPRPPHPRPAKQACRCPAQWCWSRCPPPCRSRPTPDSMRRT